MTKFRVFIITYSDCYNVELHNLEESEKQRQIVFVLLKENIPLDKEYETKQYANFIRDVLVDCDVIITSGKKESK